MNLSVFYRGPLTSCNYACGYCPFAKRMESDARLADDKTSLANFVRWIEQQSAHRWRVLFTPWGEALVRSWYRAAMAQLSHLPNLESVAAQTNLSCGIDWLNDCDFEKTALWVTFHPTEIDLNRFVQKVVRVFERGVRLSVGVVGVPAAFDVIRELRSSLPEQIYLWINPQQPRARPYSDDELNFMASIDPYFPRTSQPQRTFGLPCRAGHASFTVDGNGDMRSCHFVDQVIGNIQYPDWEASLTPRVCPNRMCHCYLGLSQFEPLRLDQVFGDQILQRIPLEF